MAHHQSEEKATPTTAEQPVLSPAGSSAGMMDVNLAMAFQQQFDNMRLNAARLGQTTPLMAVSPQQQSRFLRPAVAGYVSPGSDWHQQYLQVATLQSSTAGFLSPAGHPMSPGGRIIWSDVAGLIPSAAPSDVTQTLSGPALQQQRSTTADGYSVKGVDSGRDMLISGVTEVGDEPSYLPAPAINWAQSAEAHKPDGRLIDTVLHSKSLTEQLLREFGLERAVEVLKTALALLGRPPETENGNSQASLPSVKLVHPDEFKNPSTFLKIYGDPLCFAKNGPLPKKGRNGNWECPKCNNVNFPRRFRCNMCSTSRDAEGDWVVADYARQVYERYLFIYKNQQRAAGITVGSQHEDGSKRQEASSTVSGPQDLAHPVLSARDIKEITTKKGDMQRDNRGLAWGRRGAQNMKYVGRRS